MFNGDGVLAYFMCVFIVGICYTYVVFGVCR